MLYFTQAKELISQSRTPDSLVHTEDLDGVRDIDVWLVRRSYTMRFKTIWFCSLLAAGAAAAAIVVAVLCSPNPHSTTPLSLPTTSVDMSSRYDEPEVFVIMLITSLDWGMVARSDRYSRLNDGDKDDG